MGLECQSFVMTRPWRCRLGMHQWHDEWDHERHMQIKRCLRCDFRLSKGIPPHGVAGAP
jgi:hypothetical protein